MTRSNHFMLPVAVDPRFRGTAAWWTVLVLIGLIALGLRTYGLARRPMHADEANQAVKTGILIERGEYAFDPRDHHGPTLYYGAAAIAWLRGQHTLAQLDEVSVRLVPALMGVLAVILLAWLALPLGPWSSLVAAAFLTISPPAVYYARYFIQETLLVTFTLGCFAAGRAWWDTGHRRWAVTTGIFAGLMLATKASAPLFLVAAVVAVGLTRGSSPAKPGLVRAGLYAAIVALVVAALFYSSFGTNLRGLRDALDSYGLIGARVSGVTGHEKPWWYYPGLLGWQKNGGLVWHQLFFSTLALAGCGVAIVTRDRFLRGVAIYTGLVLVGLSLPAYKTPWHVVHLLPGMAWLAAAAVSAVRHRVMAAGLFIGGILTLGQQTGLVAFQRPADARNPYAYVHSSPDVLKYRPLAGAALAGKPDGVVRVIGEEYWPLPWYLRDIESIGYWRRAPEECDGALVIVNSAQADEVRARLRGNYRESFLGLRPGVICVVFTAVP